ncbi:hybrid histidine kinase [Tritrichomonas foetus]|uniref:Hybrid histidine kinase n=1 Tax=Tritrichomonas foetus TaxID=1144522 RepID=A0A1J4KKK9_9EUKA|nr:hybrid histidine kinase [Tritrichomonas foetus]|eukprot:OHT09901.1 hybrid histidine kinase [Tritrichomonas foetus]
MLILLFLDFALAARIAVNGFMPLIFKSKYSHFILGETTKTKSDAEIYIVESAFYNQVPNDYIEVCSFREKIPEFALFSKIKTNRHISISPDVEGSETLSSIIFAYDISVTAFSPDFLISRDSDFLIKSINSINNLNNTKSERILSAADQEPSFLILPKGSQPPNGFKQVALKKTIFKFLQNAQTDFYVFTKSSSNHKNLANKICSPIYEPKTFYLYIVIFLLFVIIVAYHAYSSEFTKINTKHDFWIFDRNENILHGKDLNELDEITRSYVIHSLRVSIISNHFISTVIKMTRKEKVFVFKRNFVFPIKNKWFISFNLNENFPISDKLAFDVIVKSGDRIIDANPSIKLSSYRDYRPIHLSYTLDNNIKCLVDLPTSALAPFQPFGQLFTLILSIFYKFEDLVSNHPYFESNFSEFLDFCCKRLYARQCYFFSHNHLKYEYNELPYKKYTNEDLIARSNELINSTGFTLSNDLFDDGTRCFIHRIKSGSNDIIFLLAFLSDKVEQAFEFYALPLTSFISNFLYQNIHVEKRLKKYESSREIIKSFNTVSFIEIAIKKHSIISFDSPLIENHPATIAELKQIIKDYSIEDYQTFREELDSVIRREKVLNHHPITAIINGHKRYIEVSALISDDSTLDDQILVILAEDVTSSREMENELIECLPEIKQAFSSLAMISFTIIDNEVIIDTDELFVSLGLPIPKDRALKPLLHKDDLIKYEMLLTGERGTFRLVDNDGVSLSYSGFSDGENGYLIDLLSFAGIRDHGESLDEGLQLAASNAHIIFWAIDLRTDTVKPLYKQPTIWDSLSVERDMKFSRIIEYIYTDDREYFIQNYNDVIHYNKEQWTGEARLLRIGGIYEYHKFVITRANDFLLNCVALNINKQKEMESKLSETQRLRDLLLSSKRLALWTFRNDKTEIPFKHQSFDDMVTNDIEMNWNSLNIIHPEYRSEFAKKLELTLENGDGMEIDLPLLLNGKEIWVSFRGRFKPSMKNIVGVCIHITELRSALLQLETETRRAEIANSQKTVFLANMSHEIRTPMNGIFGMLDILATKELTTEQRLLVDSIRASTFQLMNLLDDTLKLTKIEQGDIESSPSIFSLTKAVEPIFIATALRASQSKLKFNVSISQKIPKLMFGELQLTLQIINNLVSNALKFTKQGSISINLDWQRIKHQNASQTNHSKNVSSRIENDSGSYDDDVEEICIIEVIDTGIGISPEQQRFIFDRFKQANQSVARFFGGSGLGLALVQDIVHFMQGQIEIDSDVGHGTRFTCKIPMMSIMNEYSPPFLDGKKHIIMTMIDDKLLSDSIQEWMTFHKYEIIPFESPDEIIEKISMVNTASPDKVSVDAIFVEGRKDTWQRIKHSVTRISNGKSIVICAIIEPGDQPEAVLKYTMTKPILLPNLVDFMNGIRYKKNDFKLPSQEKVCDDKTQKILVVEDNKTNQFVMKKILQNIGCPMRIAENGKEAIDALEQEEFDLIFMDCQMPVLDGIEATKIIRSCDKNYSSIPIIALTASAVEGDEETCRKAGMDAYLSKPVRIQQIKNIIAQFNNQH